MWEQLLCLYYYNKEKGSNAEERQEGSFLIIRVASQGRDRLKKNAAYRLTLNSNIYSKFLE
jgi:hypothetical protein